MASISTRTGDDGNTSLFGGGRVAKDDPRVEAYGNVDELNSAIGLALAEPLDDRNAKALRRVQGELFELGAELATRREGNPNASKVAPFGDGPLAGLDEAVVALERSLKPLQAFILPAGSRPACLLHLARAVCRRAERSVVALAHRERVPASVIRYLNRLSDVLFLMARQESARAGGAEVEWRP
jgi:cob(I)alamin adenosyltransferase